VAKNTVYLKSLVGPKQASCYTSSILRLNFCQDMTTEHQRQGVIAEIIERRRTLYNIDSGAP
jgi:hypothetical protein